MAIQPGPFSLPFDSMTLTAKHHIQQKTSLSSLSDPAGSL
jgi:hypothetical protein